MNQLPRLDETVHRAAGGKASFAVIVRDCAIKSPGQLTVHGRVLEDAGLVKIRKTFVDNRPLTTLTLTPKGRSAFAAHMANLDAMAAPAAPVEVVA
jgi:winged helix DNA-binding protein